MRRLLRNIQTREYYSHGTWTQDAVLAQDFPDTMAAVRITIEQKLPAVEIVLQLGAEASQEYDICVPLTTVQSWLGEQQGRGI